MGDLPVITGSNIPKLLPSEKDTFDPITLFIENLVTTPGMRVLYFGGIKWSPFYHPSIVTAFIEFRHFNFLEMF